MVGRENKQKQYGKKNRSSKRTASIWIEPYLAEYISEKYKKDPETGGIKIPYTTDLYYVVWNLMSKPQDGQMPVDNANLCIHLPHRRHWMDDLPGKDPAYFNHLSRFAAKKIEAAIRLMFNFELHRVLMENEEFGRQRRNQDVVADFIHAYHLTAISPDALLKNYYRYRNRICPKKKRKYQKNKGI